MVHFDVHLEFLVESVCAEESYNRFSVGVVLVLGGLHGFRLNQECSLEAVGAGIVACRSEHLCEVVFLALHLGVEKGSVAFASAPEHIARASELDCGVDGILDLHGCAGNYIKIGIGGCSVHVALVSEYIGCAPEKFDSAFLHLCEGIVGNRLHPGFILFDGVGFFHKVHIVEAEILDAEFFHDFETCIHLVLGALQGVGGLVPLIASCLSAELVAGSLPEGMPPCHRKLVPVLHLPAEHNTLSVIIMERKGILAFGSFERDSADFGKVLFHFYVFLIYWLSIIYLKSSAWFFRRICSQR